jgi:hypothetical protein
MKTPFTLNGVTFNDGDYISLSLPQPAGNSTLNSLSTYSDFPNSPAPPLPNLGPLYLSSTQFSVRFKLPPTNSLTYPNYASEVSSTQRRDFTSTATPNQFSFTEIARKEGTMVNDAVFTTQKVFRVNAETTYNDGSTPSNVPSGVVATRYYSVDRPKDPVNCSTDFRLCLEFHENDYIALRSVNGRYFHLKSCYDAATGSRRSGVPNRNPENLVLTLTTEPSELYSAQWRVYLASNATSTIVLQNRQTGTFLSMASGNSSVATVELHSYGEQGFNYLSRPGAYTDNPQTQKSGWYDLFGQPYNRALTAPTRIGAEMTIAKIAETTCDASINPMYSLCKPSDDAVKVGLRARCSSGDMPTTPTCRTFLIGQNDAVADIIESYCGSHPNDRELCGCKNIWEYKGLIDYIGLSNEPVGLIPDCNVLACTTNRTTAWHASSKQVTCQQAVCAQGVSIGTSINSGLKVNQSCNIQQNVDANVTGAAGPSDLYALGVLQRVTEFFSGITVVRVLMLMVVYLVVTALLTLVSPEQSFTVPMSIFLMFLICIPLTS